MDPMFFIITFGAVAVVTILSFAASWNLKLPTTPLIRFYKDAPFVIVNEQTNLDELEGILRECHSCGAAVYLSGDAVYYLIRLAESGDTYAYNFRMMVALAGAPALEQMTAVQQLSLANAINFDEALQKLYQINHKEIERSQEATRHVMTAYK